MSARHFSLRQNEPKPLVSLSGSRDVRIAGQSRVLPGGDPMRGAMARNFASGSLAI